MHDSAVDVLINTKEPFYFSPERDQLFLDAMRQAFKIHYENCLPYRKICCLEGFTPDCFLDYEDIFFIPHLFVTVLKSRHFASVPQDQVEITLKSSGTAGQTSAISLDRITLNRIQKIVWNIYESYGMANKNLVSNCILFSYEYGHAKDVGTAFSDQLLSGLTGVKELVYALKYNSAQNTFDLDTEGIIDALIEFDRQHKESGIPLRIIGFPAFLFELHNEYRRRNLPPLHLGNNSYIIIGGGWKTKADREIPKQQFKELMSRWLGIPSHNVRDLFGMVEHGVPYCECSEGNMHVPIYSRVVTRDPESLRILPAGDLGLFHFYTPYLNSFPAISLLTTDKGIVENNCPCGVNAPYIIPAGRAGVQKHKGCAIQALDYLKTS